MWVAGDDEPVVQQQEIVGQLAVADQHRLPRLQLPAGVVVCVGGCGVWGVGCGVWGVWGGVGWGGVGVGWGGGVCGVWGWGWGWVGAHGTEEPQSGGRRADLLRAAPAGHRSARRRGERPNHVTSPPPVHLSATMCMLPPGPGAILALGLKEWLAMSIRGSMAAGCKWGGEGELK